MGSATSEKSFAAGSALNMIVDVIGVGRSGTTALYVLLQHMMRNNLDGEVKSFYEPFLRDRDFIGDDYTDAQGKFKLIDSLSAYGIYAHTQLPMLITKMGDCTHTAFLEGVYGTSRTGAFRQLMFGRENHETAEHRLVKYIRACGRYRMIRKVAPQGKSIFIIRNPLDVANSIKDRFSFYGGEFHRDDEDRFIHEVNSFYKQNYSKDQFHSYLESQLFYWYYSNRFALESFQSERNQPHSICYEGFFGDLPRGLQGLCDFLQFECRPEYVDFFSNPIGPESTSKTLPARDKAMLEDYLGRYFELLATHRIETSASPENLLSKFDYRDEIFARKESTYGLHSRAVARTIMREPPPLTEPESSGAFFSHLINPVVVPQTSDLFIAQPITFESMAKAKVFAGTQGINVEQLAAFYPEDRSYVPSTLKLCEPLSESCLDFAKLEPARRLPLVREVFDRANVFGAGEYIIYTNVDIALMPHFYFSLAHYLKNGDYDFINVCRRTLSSEYTSSDQLPYMYSDIGISHPGTDCFVFKRSLLDKFVLENIVFGARYVALSIRMNLYAFSTNTLEISNQHLTFHIGDDRGWSKQSEYEHYNQNELEKILVKLSAREDLVNMEMLSKLQAEFKSRKKNSI